MMSAPAVNSVLPVATGTTLPLPVSPVKISPPSPPISKSPVTQNHSAPSPLSLVNEKAKTPEKPRDLTPPTSNGLEESSVPKEPVLAQPEEAPPAAPVAPPTINHTSEPTASVKEKEPEPEPVEAAPVSPVVPPAVAEPEPAPPKPAKPQGAKRRREPVLADAPAVEESRPEKKPRRARAPVHHYQSPLPEITTVINRSLKIKDNTPKSPTEKLVIFYKNEFLAVRNAEGGFYLCQTMQNIFRSSHRIRIRWLSMDDKEKADDGGIYTRDFYDITDFECILTNVTLKKEDKNKYKLPNTERDRVENILKRGLEVEQGVSEKPAVTEDHPDGIDISLYRDESQLQKTKKSHTKRKSSPTVQPSSPKKVKKSLVKPKKSKVETKIPKSPVKAKVKSKKPNKIAALVKPSQEKPKPSRAERTAARDKKTGLVDPLKVSPPNEKARVVAKILRKFDASPAKGEGSSDKKSKSVSKTTKKSAKNEKAPEKGESKKLDQKKVKPITPVSATAISIKKTDKDDKKGSSRRSAVATKKGRK